jgi:uncharacterized membrane protein
MKRIFVLIFLSILLLNPLQSQARDNITDWYIKDLKTNITVNKDSSLDITEWITADCGNSLNKHGIFRMLPTGYYNNPNDWVSSPVKLVSITDFNGNKINYTQSKDSINHTITWKIGDADITVRGINYYLIKYHVDNAIRTNNANYDLFDWNVNGAFWDLEIDAFNATVTFPTEVNLKSTPIDLYSGSLSIKENTVAKYELVNNYTLKIDSTKTLKTKQAITTKINLPKIFTPYEMGPFQQYGWYLSLLLPIIALIFSYSIWKRYGKDPKNNRTIVPEFEIPDNLSPLELGMVLTDGDLESKFISAEIINLGVQGVIKIEKIEKKGLFGTENYKIIKTGKNENLMSKHQKSLLDKMFATALENDFIGNLAKSKTWGFLAKNIIGKPRIDDTVKDVNEMLISDLKNMFYISVAELKIELTDDLKTRKLLISRRGLLSLFIFLGALSLGGIFLAYYMIFLFNFDIKSLLLTIPSFIICSIIFFIFAGIIKQRSSEGLVLLNKIKGFELYMKTAEKYRQQFNEKENIFEKFLPYAIMFGITKEWIEKMKDIYGEKYFSSYAPIWFMGGNIASFDAGSIDSAISSMSSSMNSAMSAASSSGGGGAGGGGGGGGGGGW